MPLAVNGRRMDNPIINAAAFGAGCDPLRSYGQGVFEQWQHIQNSIDFSRTVARMPKIVAATKLGLAASQPAAEQIRQRCILDCDDDLPAGSTDGREDFDEIQRSIVVNMLNR